MVLCLEVLSPEALSLVVFGLEVLSLEPLGLVVLGLEVLSLEPLGLVVLSLFIETLSFELLSDGTDTATSLLHVAGRIVDVIMSSCEAAAGRLLDVIMRSCDPEDDSLPEHCAGSEQYSEPV